VRPLRVRAASVHGVACVRCAVAAASRVTRHAPRAGAGCQLISQCQLQRPGERSARRQALLRAVSLAFALCLLLTRLRSAQIAKRRRAHQEKNPNVRIISLGIGDTTEPIPAPIAAAMEKSAAGLGTVAGYSGYGAEQGQGALRQALADAFYPVRSWW
jgi:hypothetical protein